MSQIFTLLWAEGLKPMLILSAILSFIKLILFLITTFFNCKFDNIVLKEFDIPSYKDYCKENYYIHNRFLGYKSNITLMIISSIVFLLYSIFLFYDCQNSIMLDCEPALLLTIYLIKCFFVVACFFSIQPHSMKKGILGKLSVLVYHYFLWYFFYIGFSGFILIKLSNIFTKRPQFKYHKKYYELAVANFIIFVLFCILFIPIHNFVISNDKSIVNKIILNQYKKEKDSFFNPYDISMEQLMSNHLINVNCYNSQFDITKFKKDFYLKSKFPLYSSIALNIIIIAMYILFSFITNKMELFYIEYIAKYSTDDVDYYGLYKFQSEKRTILYIILLIIIIVTYLINSSSIIMAMLMVLQLLPETKERLKNSLKANNDDLYFNEIFSLTEDYFDILHVDPSVYLNIKVDGHILDLYLKMINSLTYRCAFNSIILYLQYETKLNEEERKKNAKGITRQLLNLLTECKYKNININQIDRITTYRAPSAEKSILLGIDSIKSQVYYLSNSITPIKSIDISIERYINEKYDDKKISYDKLKDKQKNRIESKIKKIKLNQEKALNDKYYFHANILYNQFSGQYINNDISIKKIIIEIQNRIQKS